MNIGIFGGSFDPPHLSHKKIVDECISQKLVDSVWVCPTYHHVDKKHGATYEQRMKMCKIMFTSLFNRKVKVCSYEKDNNSGTTIELISKLKAKFPEHNFRIIIGEDRAETIEGWKFYKKLIKNTSFIIFKREDYVGGLYPERSKWFRTTSFHDVIKVEGCWMSSSYCRALTRSKNFNTMASIVTKPKIVDFIINKKLYHRS